MNGLDTTKTLAPSEVIVLHGAAFAEPKRGLSLHDVDFELVQEGKKVSARQLGQTVLAAALIANEQVGVVRLEVREKKALFGLRKVNALYVEPGTAGSSWPANSIEAQIRPLAEATKPGKPKEVKDVVVDLLRQDTSNPWHSTAVLVKEGMGARDLLESAQRKTMKIFSVAYWKLPEDSKLVEQTESDVAAVKAMLADYQQSQPEKWKLLVSQIESAIAFRTESDSGDMPD
jgi:hypothetical protein